MIFASRCAEVVRHSRAAPNERDNERSGKAHWLCARICAKRGCCASKKRCNSPFSQTKCEKKRETKENKAIKGKMHSVYETRKQVKPNFTTFLQSLGVELANSMRQGIVEKLCKHILAPFCPHIRCLPLEIALLVPRSGSLLHTKLGSLWPSPQS